MPDTPTDAPRLTREQAEAVPVPPTMEGVTANWREQSKGMYLYRTRIVVAGTLGREGRGQGDGPAR